MSDRAPVRKPAAFRLDDPNVNVAIEPVAPPPPATPPTEGLAAARPDSATPTARRALAKVWPRAFGFGLAGLVSLGFGLAVTRLIEDLFARSEILGYAGLALAGMTLLALLVMVGRELAAIARLDRIDAIRDRAGAILANDSRAEGLALVRDVLAQYRRTPALARARAQVESHLGAIIDGADLVRLLERELMTPLDEEARRMVSAAATRVSVVTAVSPRALFDVAFVMGNMIHLVRRLALLYRGRPGAIGMLRLTRHALAHLALTGGIAVGDSLVQQLIGHGVSAKLSARLGEGVLNGLLTARLGLAAIEVIRPLPFAALKQPSINDLAGSLLAQRKPQP